MSNQQTPITEERLKEIEQQALGTFPPPPKGYQAAGGLAVMAAIEYGKKKALAAVPDLVAEIHRLWAKVAEQGRTITTLKIAVAELEDAAASGPDGESLL